jgi:hypothetical protein
LAYFPPPDPDCKKALYESRGTLLFVATGAVSGREVRDGEFDGGLIGQLQAELGARLAELDDAASGLQGLGATLARLLSDRVVEHASDAATQIADDEHPVRRRALHVRSQPDLRHP